MRKEYPSWSRQNLFDRGKGANARLGWINNHGFDKSLREFREKLTKKVNDDAEDLYIGIKSVRQSLQQLVIEKKTTKDDIYQYRDFCKLEIEARRHLDLGKDNLETFVACYEKVIHWLGDIDAVALKHLVQHGDRLIELAKAHYGETETNVDGTGSVANENGK